MILIITIGLLLFAGIHKVQSDDCGNDAVCYKYQQLSEEQGVKYKKIDGVYKRQ